MSDVLGIFYGASAGVARPSQPWASRRNPFGILERQHLPEAPYTDSETL
jgi:hypothetical protein